MLLLRQASRLPRLGLLLVAAFALLLPAAGSAQDVSKENFLAEHYDVAASIEPASQ